MRRSKSPSHPGYSYHGTLEPQPHPNQFEHQIISFKADHLDHLDRGLISEAQPEARERTYQEHPIAVGIPVTAGFISPELGKDSPMGNSQHNGPAPPRIRSPECVDLITPPEIINLVILDESQESADHETLEQPSTRQPKKHYRSPPMAPRRAEQTQ